MSRRERKLKRDAMTRVRRVIREAFPGLEPVFGRHGDYGGHRAPRVRTLSFRLRDERGRFHSNVVWLDPRWLSRISVDEVQELVRRSNGRK